MLKLMTTNWNFFRVLRLIMGLIIIAQAILSKDVLFGVAGFIFTLLPLFNQGCCGTQSYCQNNVAHLKNNTTSKEKEYEEVV